MSETLASEGVRLKRPVPVTVLSGFLGSGKTTVLRHVLQTATLSDAAVVINEFGDVGIDNLLISRVDDATVLLDNGCICCNLQDDLVHTLRQLFVRRADGRLPPFRRILIETTGLASPAALVQPLLKDQLLADACRLDGVVVTADASTVAESLERHPEAAQQIAVADRLLVTKTDIAGEHAVADAVARIRAFNLSAPLCRVVNGAVDAEFLINAGYYDHESGRTKFAQWLPKPGRQHAANGRSIRTFTLHFGAPLPQTGIARALSNLVAAAGPRILRMKGLVAIEGYDGPVVLHAVQHLLHPPVVLDGWPDADRSSRLVFITNDLAKAEVEAILDRSLKRPALFGRDA